MAVEYIIKNALVRRTLDNVTVVIIAFSNFKRAVFGKDDKIPLPRGAGGGAVNRTAYEANKRPPMSGKVEITQIAVSASTPSSQSFHR